MDMTQLHRHPPEPQPAPTPVRVAPSIDAASYPMIASDVVVELGCSDARQCTQYNNNNSPMVPGLATVVCVREVRSVGVAMVHDEMRTARHDNDNNTHPSSCGIVSVVG